MSAHAFLLNPHVQILLRRGQRTDGAFLEFKPKLQIGGGGVAHHSAKNRTITDQHRPSTPTQPQLTSFYYSVAPLGDVGR